MIKLKIRFNEKQIRLNEKQIRLKQAYFEQVIHLNKLLMS